jgi:hypothetical protein
MQATTRHSRDWYMQSRCQECETILGNDTHHPGFCSMDCKETWGHRDAEWEAEIAETESEEMTP